MQRNLLLVDDEPNIPRALKRALRDEHYEVHTAHSGQEAMQLIDEHAFDVVVSDYRMPGMNGAEFLARVRESSPNTVRLMLSGQADLDAVIAAVNSGNIYKFLTKPWTNEHIREEIRGAFQLATAATRDEESGYLTSRSFRDELARSTSAESVRLLVGEFKNSASVKEVLDEEQYRELTSEVASRCGDTLVAHGMLAPDMFAFALGGERANDTSVEQIIRDLTQPVDVSDRKISLDVYLGYADACANEDVDELIRRATIALTMLDKESDTRAAAYSEDSATKLHLRHTLEHDMHRALEKREFFLMIQPQVDARTLRICGGEALVRWQHPTQGLISPLQFIDQAERNGFIHELGLWVMQQTLVIARELRTLGTDGVRIGVNVSPRQFQQGFDAPWVHLLEKTALHEPGLLKLLELEITESTVMDDPATAAELIDKLSGLGLSIALDDFGTGHSSLAQLNSLPIDCLKLDRSLISNVANDVQDRTLAAHLAAMAKGLGFEIVAEGLEEPEQIQFCQNNGCHRLQGFAFHRPLVVEDFLMKMMEEQLVQS